VSSSAPSAVLSRALRTQNGVKKGKTPKTHFTGNGIILNKMNTNTITRTHEREQKLNSVRPVSADSLPSVHVPKSWNQSLRSVSSSAHGPRNQNKPGKKIQL
jgi:hypothetical protein